MVSNKGGLDIHHSGEAMPTTEERLRDVRNRKAQRASAEDKFVSMRSTIEAN